MNRSVLDKLIIQIEGMRFENKQDINATVHKQLISQLKKEEFDHVLSILDEITFAEPKSIKTLFLYKLKSDLDQIDIANDVIRDFQTGRFDPTANGNLQMKFKSQKAKRKANKLADF